MNRFTCFALFIFVLVLGCKKKDDEELFCNIPEHQVQVLDTVPREHDILTNSLYGDSISIYYRYDDISFMLNRGVSINVKCEYQSFPFENWYMMIGNVVSNLLVEHTDYIVIDHVHVPSGMYLRWEGVNGQDVTSGDTIFITQAYGNYYGNYQFLGTACSVKTLYARFGENKPLQFDMYFTFKVHQFDIGEFLSKTYFWQYVPEDCIN